MGKIKRGAASQLEDDGDPAAAVAERPGAKRTHTDDPAHVAERLATRVAPRHAAALTTEVRTALLAEIQLVTIDTKLARAPACAKPNQPAAAAEAFAAR